MSVVHIQTTIQTVFGVVDEEGNVVQKVPVNLEVQKLEGHLFEEAANHLLSAKEKLAENEKAAVAKPAETEKPARKKSNDAK